MTVLDKIRDRIERVLATPAGEALLTDLERTAAEREAALEARRTAAETIDRCKTALRTEVRALRAKYEALTAEHQVARRAERAARDARARAGRTMESRHSAIQAEILAAERVLRLGADPRIVEVRNEIARSIAEWPRTSAALLESHSGETRVPVQPGEPGFMGRGTTRKILRRGTNAAGVLALKTQLDTALKDVDALMLELEPTNLDARLAKLRAAAGPFDAPAIVWQDGAR